MFILFNLLELITGRGVAGFHSSGPHFLQPECPVMYATMLCCYQLFTIILQLPCFLSHSLTFLVYHSSCFTYVKISYLHTPSYKQRSALSPDQGLDSVFFLVFSKHKDLQLRAHLPIHLVRNLCVKTRLLRINCLVSTPKFPNQTDP